ncbi:hypothetical protein QVM87_21090 [Providencia stuartii]|nr:MULTISPECIES: hypothetical protein [Providencia]MDN0012494.1 hypothetical protein [Providencia stuartii]
MFTSLKMKEASSLPWRFWAFNITKVGKYTIKLQPIIGLKRASYLTDKQEFYQLIDYTDDVDLHEKLAEWEAFYDCHCSHSAHAGKTPYEVLKNKLSL